MYSAIYFLIGGWQVQVKFIIMLMPGPKRTRRVSVIIRIVAFVAVFFLLYAVVPQLAFFDGARAELRELQPLWLVAAGVAFLATYAAAALMYACLSRRRIPLGRTMLIQVAAAFANRLLPAGSGAVAVSYGYLRRRHYNGPEAAGIIAMNNVLGVVGHVCIVVVALALDPSVLHRIRLPAVSWSAGLLVIAVAAVCIVFWHWHKRTLRFVRSMFRDLTRYERRPGKIMLALGISICLTLLYTLSFYCCVRACGLELGSTATLVVFTFSVLVGAVTPSPGGAGGVEVALVGGLAGFGVAPASALAVALSYRLITFWLALLLGAAGLSIVLRNHLVTP